MTLSHLIGTSGDEYYLLPPDYARVEKSGVAISKNGTSEWIPASPDDTLEMCRTLEMKYIRFHTGKLTLQTNQEPVGIPTIAETLM